jgi:predicted GNAT family acetyltransferase
VSGERLAVGTLACYLYTDMANPTSNRIYTDVGYRLITRSQEHVFAP